MKSEKEIEAKIKKLEEFMTLPGFWSDKNKAQSIIKELIELKAKLGGFSKYDKGNAVLTIISGAGGDDAEDFSRMLFEMYEKYASKCGWEISFIHQHKNEHKGYRSISVEVKGSTRQDLVGPYGILKNESGVHRLVRISPFDAKKLRHTSFSLVEVLPKFSKLEEKDVVFSEADLKIEFTRSGGPGGQNVNRRETAVRVVHLPTGLSAEASLERTQEQNREQALSILRAKIFKKAEAEKKSVEESMRLNKGIEIEWGNQIRSYVLHPYKMVKDHRTEVETSKVDEVLSGELDIFLEAEKNL